MPETDRVAASMVVSTNLCGTGGTHRPPIASQAEEPVRAGSTAPEAARGARASRLLTVPQAPEVRRGLVVASSPSRSQSTTVSRYLAGQPPEFLVDHRGPRTAPARPRARPPVPLPSPSPIASEPRLLESSPRPAEPPRATRDGATRRLRSSPPCEPAPGTWPGTTPPRHSGPVVHGGNRRVPPVRVAKRGRRMPISAGSPWVDVKRSSSWASDRPAEEPRAHRFSIWWWIRENWPARIGFVSAKLDCSFSLIAVSAGMFQLFAHVRYEKESHRVTSPSSSGCRSTSKVLRAASPTRTVLGVDEKETSTSTATGVASMQTRVRRELGEHGKTVGWGDRVAPRRATHWRTARNDPGGRQQFTLSWHRPSPGEISVTRSGPAPACPQNAAAIGSAALAS